MTNRKRMISRHMPKYRFQPKPLGPVVWLVLGASLAGAVWFVVSAPKAAAICGALFLVLIALSHAVVKRDIAHLRALAAARPGQSICAFARDFDRRSVDAWVVRAVYEQLQSRLEHAHPAFPIRARDRLRQDLRLDEDDIDLDLAPEIETRTGRSLDHAQRNPLFGKVETAGDLVLFFQAQPRRTPTV